MDLDIIIHEVARIILIGLFVAAVAGAIHHMLTEGEQ